MLLAACGGQPLRALQWSEDGIDAKLWMQLPSLVQRGLSAPFLNWPLPRLVDTLQKLCHDALCIASGSAPRYFPVGAIAAGAAMAPLTGWAGNLARLARHAEHPWSAGLAVESMIDEAHRALTVGPRIGPRRPGISVHLGA